jgi:hypothetical protein
MHDLKPREDLLHGERLLIRTVRLLALATPCHSLRAHFEAACGDAGQSAYRMLEAFVQQLGARGRRRLTLSIPADPRLTDDEALILDAFGCAQAEDYRSLDERLTGLLGAEPPFPLGAAACVVAETLGMNGLMLRALPAPSSFIPSSRVDRDACRMAAE